MTNILAYPAFLATVISVIGLTRIAYKEHDHLRPRTLSELAAAEERLLNHFRNILWLCGTLFAVTMYGFVIPRSPYALPLAIGWSLEIFGEMLLAIIPARDKTIRIHELLAQIMGAGMLGLAVAFCFSTHGVFAVAEIVISVAMSVMGILTFTDKKRFIFYELPFIYLSHISILVAVLAIS